MNREDIQQLVRSALIEKIGGQPQSAAPASDVIDESVKHVITESDVQALPVQAKLLIREDAIITPAAQDVLRERGIQIRYRTQSSLAGNRRVIALGADHGGFEVKEGLKKLLTEAGYTPRDFGTFSTDAVDYPDFAHAVARAVADGVCDLGIIVDGAGIGSCMAANKVPGVRAALCYDEASARNSREHNYANVLTLGGKLQTPAQLQAIVQAWLKTPEGEARHGKRVAKIMAIEKQYLR
jgi:ribose 5-phosphate isomerase B